MLKQYATNSLIKEALENLRSMTQKPGETEHEFHTRFVKSHERARYPLDVNERITTFIDGLNPRLRPFLHVFREEHQGNHSTCKT